MPYALTWLADALRAAGCRVVEQPGWQMRGRGQMGTVRGVLCHDTAGPRSGGNAPSLVVVQNGRLTGPDPLPGPLSQLVLGRDGTFYVVAAGLCNHAGPGFWHGVSAGNHELIGIEAENAGDGEDPWPTIQLSAYVIGVAAILKHLGADAVMCAGHKEYALPRGRKIDPTFDMVAFREHVEQALGNSPTPPAGPVRVTDPARAMLRKGDMNESVRQLQEVLGIKVNGQFGPATDTAVRAFQKLHGLKPDGLVGPATWAALGR